jgi:hypothetical protein
MSTLVRFIFLMISIGCGWRLLVAAIDITRLTNELPFSSQTRVFCFQKTFEAIGCAKDPLGFAKATNFAMILSHMGTIFVIFCATFSIHSGNLRQQARGVA